MKRVIFFPNGHTAVFDERGQQVPELQRAWIKLFAEFLDDHDEDPVEFEFTLPDGTKAKLFETAAGYDWRISL
jgi:hypothetical protein